MTKAELLVYAEVFGVEVSSRNTKAQIIEAIEAKEAEE